MCCAAPWSPLLDLGVRQLKQHLAPVAGRGRLGERPAEQPGRGGGVAPGQRARRRLAQGRHRPLVAVGPGEEQLGDDGIGGRAVGGEQVRGPAVGARPREGRDVGVDAGGDQRVGEAQWLARGHDVRAGQRVGRLLGRCRRPARPAPRLAHRGPVAKHRDGLGQHFGGLAEAGQADEHRAQHRVGNQGRTRATEPAVGAIPSARSARSSSVARNGFPPLTSAQALVNAGSARGQLGACHHGDRLRAERPRPEQRRGRPGRAASRAPAGPAACSPLRTATTRTTGSSSILAARCAR